MYNLSKLKRVVNNENNRAIFYNAIGAFLVRGGSLIISFLTMPAYLRYFENAQILGLWFTILSVLTWVLTFDLGIGNGLRNYLVPALVKKDKLLVKKYISSAYILIGVLVLFICCLAAIAFRYINWNIIFNIHPTIVSNATLNITISIVFGGIMLQFIFKLIMSILYAMQKSALNNLLGLLSNIIIFVFVSLSNSSDIENNLISLAVVHVFAVNLPLLLASIIIFSTKLRESRPSIYYFDINYGRKVMRLGGVFFWIQIMYMLITTTNEILITWLTGTEMVVEYQIYNKLFTLIGTIFTLALTPIWSAVTKALSEKNYIWIKKLYKTLNLMALFAVIFQFCMIPVLQHLVDFWLGDNTIKVNYVYAVIFAISGSVFILNGVLSSIANGLGKLKVQSILFTMGAIIKVPIAWALVMVFDSWIGVVVANIVALSFYCIIQPIWFKRLLEKVN